MTEYGLRLSEAMRRAGVDRKALADALGISVQAVGQAINGRGGLTKGLSFQNNARAAQLLGVDPHWLSTGRGASAAPSSQPASTPQERGLSESAAELGALLDMIPKCERIARATAYNAASEAILRILAKLNPPQEPRSQDG